MTTPIFSGAALLWRASVAPLLVCIMVMGCGSAPPPQTANAPLRVITLAPHLTELMYAADAGDFLVGTVEHSDYPEEATTVPRIGDAFRLDFEAVTTLRPDLILAWQGGNPPSVLERLRSLGHRVVALEAARVDAPAENLRAIARLIGRPQPAGAIARQYDAALRELRDRYATAQSLSVFYQVSWEPLFTIAGRHTIAQAINLCGGRNVFGELDELSPTVSVESVLARNPDVIIASDFGQQRQAQLELEAWRDWPSVTAVAREQLYSVDADLMVRPGLRLIDGVMQLCERLDDARAKSGLAFRLPQRFGATVTHVEYARNYKQ